MSILKQLVFKNNTAYGSVDLGTGGEQVIEEETEFDLGDLLDSEDKERRKKSTDLPPLAKHALVFMIVALKENWKVLIGHFSVDTFTSEERGNLIREALILLQEHDVVIKSITFNGTTINFESVEI